MWFSAKIDLKTTSQQSYQCHTNASLQSVSVEYVTVMQKINTTGEGQFFFPVH